MASRYTITYRAANGRFCQVSTKFQILSVIALNVLGQMMLLPAYPFWSLTVVAADVVALYALTVYGGAPVPDTVHADEITWTRPPGVPRPPV